MKIIWLLFTEDFLGIINSNYDTLAIFNNTNETIYNQTKNTPLINTNSTTKYNDSDLINVSQLIDSYFWYSKGSSLKDFYINLLLAQSTFLIISYKLSVIRHSFFRFVNFFTNYYWISLVSYIIYSIFFTSYIQSYTKQTLLSINLVKLFITTENEKEIGPVDDIFAFALLFILAISSFIIGSLFIVISQISFFSWIIGSLILVAILFLTIPLTLFIDFGISFFSFIRGSSPSSSLVRELLFDLISSFTIFIRFVIQNIRFLFIFLAIFELLEWIFDNNSSLFLMNFYTNNNLFVNVNKFDYNMSTTSFNILIINTILSLIFYMYYFLHLLFLLLVQTVIYIGISVWLFFFLYSTKFLGKYEKHFKLKK